MITKAILTALSILIMAGNVSADEGPYPFRFPTVNETHIAFSYAGDIWAVSKKGGTARQLTKTEAIEYEMVFSPDNKWIAFTRQTGGSEDIYLMPAQGGEEKRLTYQPKSDTIVAWSKDSRKILFASWRDGDRPPRLYEVAIDGTFPQELPLPYGYIGDYSPDGKYLAYSPFGLRTYTWRNYRGGNTSRIWIADLTNSNIRKVPHDSTNDFYPMWIGNKIYFTSDRDGTTNLHVYDVNSESVEQLTHFEKWDIKYASANGNAIIMIQEGRLRLYDARTGELTTVNVKLDPDRSRLQPRKVNAAQTLGRVTVSHNGKHALLQARGEILTLSAEDGTVTNLTKSSNAAERNPSWSPDGKHIAYFSDASGDNQLHLLEISSGNVHRIDIEENPSFYHEIVWSPDSSKLVFTGKHLGLWLFDTKENRPQKIDVSTYAGQGDFDSSWSPDGKWIAYKKYLKNRISAIFLFSLETGKSTRVTSGMLNCFSPVFDKNGLYLYFLKANWAGAQWEVFGMSYLLVDMDWASNLYVLPLSSKTPSPALVGEKITNTTTGDITVDFTNIKKRSFKLSIPERIFMRIASGTAGTLFAYEQILPRGFTRNNLSYDLYKINTVDMKPQMFVSDINSFTVSADGKHVLYRERQTRSIVSTESAPAENEKKLDLSKLEITVNPVQEWRHILADTCRIQKHYLYDANTHGQNLDMLEEHYAAYLPNVVTRRGLTFVLNELLSHISISHMGTGGGDALPPGRRERVGVLGANVEIAHNRYRITKIFRGDNSRELTTSPLTLSGVNGKVGEYVLAVNGNEITADKNFYSYFIGMPGNPTKLKIGPSPDGTGAREVTIVPMAGDNTLRRLDWVHERRDMVNKLSGGRLAYIYIPNFGSSGMQMFTWQYWAQVDKEGIILDHRFAPGGNPGDYMIETLMRKPSSYYTFRDGEDHPFPTGVILGPRVLLINEFNASSTDTFPWMFRREEIGTIVGRKTMGAGIGGYVNIPRLIDGGRVASPNRGLYNPDGTWDIENGGVPPHVDVEWLPSEWRRGEDPQLERAVQIALEQLEKNPNKKPVRPANPVYK